MDPLLSLYGLDPARRACPPHTSRASPFETSTPIDAAEDTEDGMNFEGLEPVFQRGTTGSVSNGAAATSQRNLRGCGLYHGAVDAARLPLSRYHASVLNLVNDRLTASIGAGFRPTAAATEELMERWD